MKFEDLDIKEFYDARSSFVYGDFFNRILPHCNLYCRFGGVFSGNKFIQCAEGLQDFIKENDGKMELILIPDFDDDDKEAFTEESKRKIITKKWIVELDTIKDIFKQNHVKALAWMIVNHKLEIKLILPQDKDGKPLTKNELKGKSILNEVGIFFNQNNDEQITFNGEFNIETGEAISINTSRSWKDNEKLRIDRDYGKFNRLWSERNIFEIDGMICKIESLTDELLEYFRELAPKKQEEIEMKKLPELRPYQIDAVEKWEDNGGVGIFEMATATGKTYTSIGCIKKLEEQHEKLVVVIAAPYVNLVDQWEKELADWHISTIKLDKGWTKQIRNEISSINQTSEKRLLVFICSHAKFARDELLNEIKFCKVPSMLIVDEAHHVGSGNSIPDEDGIISTEGSRKGLISNYKYRLALSATVDRYYDDDGTEFLLDFFKGTKGISKVKTLDLEEAITEKILCEYDYHVHFVDLSAEEYELYKELTHNLMKYIFSKNPKIKSMGDSILNERAKIIRDAEAKIEKFIEIMKKIPEINHLIVFCSENQYEPLTEILENSEEKLGIEHPNYYRISHDNPSDKRDRQKILRQFAEEDYKIILANRVLDEGMDVPEIKRCIILSSTGNPTQFIQRRGRVLRQFYGTYKDGTKKEYAEIYDVLVKPNIIGMEKDSIKLERGIIRGQLKKITEMSKLARNKDVCLEKIKEFKNNLPNEFFEQQHDE